MSFRLLREDPSYFRTTVTEFFDSTIKDSIWYTLKNVTNYDFFVVLVFGFIFMAIVLREQIAVNTLIAFLIFLLLSYLWLSKKAEDIQEETNKNNDEVKILNKALQEKRTIFDHSARSLLHRSPVLVKIFSSLYVFARFDEKSYQEALIKANQLIRVYESCKLGTVLPSQFLDIAEHLSRDCLNHMQSMIHSLPSTSVGDFRYQVSIQILQEALQKIVDDIHLLAKVHYENVGPDIYNPPPDIRSGPFPNPMEDKDYNPHFDFY